jgi:hypothetical protein
MPLPVLLVFLFVAIVFAATGCHSNRKATVHVTVRQTGHHRTIVIPPRVRASALMNGVEGVSRGTSVAKVLSVFGRPFVIVPGSIHGRHETCWAYHAFQPRTSIDALDFCMNTKQTVERIALGVHGGAQTRTRSLITATLQKSLFGMDEFPRTEGRRPCIVHGGGPAPGTSFAGTCKTRVVWGHRGAANVYLTHVIDGKPHTWVYAVWRSLHVRLLRNFGTGIAPEYWS